MLIKCEKYVYRKRVKLAVPAAFHSNLVASERARSGVIGARMRVDFDAVPMILIPRSFDVAYERVIDLIVRKIGEKLMPDSLSI